MEIKYYCDLQTLKRFLYITLLFYHCIRKVSMYICAKFYNKFSFTMYTFY